MTVDDRRCNCRYGTVEGLKGHQVGCPMLRAPDVAARDPRRLAHPVAATCGGDAHWTPFGRDYGVPEVRPTITGAAAGLPPGRLIGGGALRMTLEPPTPPPAYQLTDAEAVLVTNCKRAEDETAMRTAIDRFLATLYDGWIDDLATKRLVITKRLGH